eukprot:TRINITY_DN33764_c0_g1_i1.p1 TRINITY_DN33764_c0_g1~~TRINITY_DN33764_c0_g1_i1.p1  ORF type:complete len:478 (+),score=72.30 TRINITY_DN33764_c0_g1_i1:101-1534(+)
MILRRCVRRCTTAAVRERIGQVAPWTHPHLMKENEVTPGISIDEYESRRKVLLSGLNTGTVFVLMGYPTKIMTRDIPFSFRQESSFWYLTGCLEPSAIAVFEKTDSSEGKWTLFVEEKDPSKELWTGIMTGPKNSKDFFKPTECHCKTKFSEKLRGILSGYKKPTIYLNKTGCTDQEEQVVAAAGGVKIEPAEPILNALRLTKSDTQVEMHVKSALITDHAFRAAMRSTVPGVVESQIYAIMEYAARVKGAQWLAYPPVVAGGDAGLSLHYVQNEQVLRDGELLLVDAGAEYWGYPTDVTRTWPVNGVFSKPQREVYEAVLRIQKEMLAAAQPGTTIASLQQLNRVLTARELLKLSILDPSKGDEEAQSSSPYVSVCFPHAFGHFMGIDIHEQSPPQVTSLIPRSMHTIEPGIYLPRAQWVPEQYRGICVRIEDNVVIGNNCNYVLTESIPKEVDEIEDLMKTRDERAVRDAFARLV